MKISNLFGKTLRDDPSEAETAGHKLLLKAGFVQPLASGIYSYMPIALRSLQKIEAIIREEMNAANGQEVLLPVLQPTEYWERSGREAVMGSVLFHLRDRRDRPLVLGPTHEEVITDLVQRIVSSYRDLPVTLYQIQTKFRDEARPRAGLIRVREFAMKDAYSFHATQESLDEGYKRIVDAYKNIFSRCGLDIALVEADSGAIGGKDSQEFMVLTDTGEDELIFCNQCNYAANQEKAASIKPPVTSSENLPIEEVSTPNIVSITDLTKFLEITADQTIKAMMYAADNEFIFVSIRGDLEVNEVKLKNFLKATDLRIATEQEVATSGAVAGFASAVGLSKIRHIADDSIKIGGNFVAGANKKDTHLKNVNYPRDFDADEIIDIATAEEGHQCTNCDGKLTVRRGIEAGHVFKVGQGYSETFNSTFLDKDGVEKPTIMGCYGIGVGRILGAAIEQHHDERGIVFPPSIAPYQIHLVGLNMENESVSSTANKIYTDLQSSGYEVIYDDREDSAGVKFNDADLLGLPLRVTVSPRTLKQNAVEIKERTEEPKDAKTVQIDKMMPIIEQIISEWR